MGILSDKAILDFHSSGLLSIAPFHEDALEAASYDMRLFWKVLVSPTRYAIGQEIDLRNEKEETLPVESGRFVACLTEEVLKIPNNVSGRFGLRSQYTRRGLVAFPGIQIDPGFKGRLAISLFNAGPEAINLKHGEKMFTVEFHSLDVPAMHPYDGPYQNQEDFPPDQREFILNAHTMSLSDIGSLPNELRNLELRFARHESEHRSGRAPLSVAELAKIQDVEPLLDLGKLAAHWPEDEDVEDFLTAVRKWRGRQD